MAEESSLGAGYRPLTEVPFEQLEDLVGKVGLLLGSQECEGEDWEGESLGRVTREHDRERVRGHLSNPNAP